jgi:signal peptidase II
MLSSRIVRLVALAFVLTCTVGCDQTSKHIARAHLGSLGPIQLPGGFGELRLAENPGSFLSLGESLPLPCRFAVFTILVGLGLVGLFLYLSRNTSTNWPFFIGLSLVWSGGVSNLIDRVARQGRVTDFVFIQVGPLHTGIFNLADLMVLMGITIAVYSFCRSNHAPKFSCGPPSACYGWKIPE